MFFPNEQSAFLFDIRRRSLFLVVISVVLCAWLVTGWSEEAGDSIQKEEESAASREWTISLGHDLKTLGLEPRELERSSAECEWFYLGAGEAGKEKEVCGERARFRFSWPEDPRSHEQLRQRLEKMGDEILYSAEDGIVARHTSEQVVLWKHFNLGGEDSSAALVRQLLLAPEEELVFSLEQEKRAEAVFYTRHPGDRLMRLDVVAPDADITLEGEFEQKSGELFRRVSFGVDCYRVHGPLHEVGSLPQYPGITKWVLRLAGGVERTEVTVRFSGGPPLESIRPGDALGGIHLGNVAYGRASVIPEFDDGIEHPAYRESALDGDRTPTGEVVFWLPPGYWTIHVTPEQGTGEQEELVDLEGHLIPVQPGRITEVDWPPSLARAFGGGESGQLEILETSADGKTGTVDLAILGNDRLGILPAPSNVRIYESGGLARILSVERIRTPPDVLLLLDSSGSMRHQMGQAIASASHFIQGLPEEARVTVVDFDTRPRKISAKNRRQLLKALRRVRANGATALYDSILLGLGELKGKNRPALVVFTDGVDANLDDTGPGSRASKEEVLEEARAAGIPIFTIGLGEASDVDTLQRLARISGGAYFRAGEPGELDPIFEQIRNNLGNWYRVRFERPPRPRFGNVPVVSLVVDNSGSMDMAPTEPGRGYRIERVRQTLRRFVGELPEDFLVQLLTFSDEVGIRQVLTRRRAPVLRGLSLMKGEGGTNTLGAVKAALDSLRAVPSSQRYLVFLTDAALAVEEEQAARFDTLLGELRDAGIRTLWLGMVEAEQEHIFARAAERSGGRYVIAADLDQVADVFGSLARELNRQVKPAGGGSLRVEIHHHDEMGANVMLVAARDVDFPPAGETDRPAQPEYVNWRIGPPLQPYDPGLAESISGSDRVGYEVLVTKRIPLERSAANRAARIRVKEAVFLSRLRGIDVPDGYRILALTVEMENILPVQRVAVLPDGSRHPAAWVAGETRPVRYENRVPTYLIPDLQRHLFLRWNNARSVPVSEVSWLLEKPLLVPGDGSLAIEPGQPVEGSIAFLVPDSAARAAALRLYDTAYGHITMPLWGVAQPAAAVPLESLPTEAPVRLSETFSFRVTGHRDLDRLANLDAGEDAVFRVFDGELISRIQAHLRFDPAARIRLRVKDKGGSYFFTLHPVTQRIPFGYYRSTLFTAGSRNRTAFAFRLPRRFADGERTMDLLFDLAGGSLVVPAAGPRGADELDSAPAARNRDVELYVHRVGPVEYVPGLGENLVAVDATFRVPPGQGHLRVGELVVLKGRKFDAHRARNEMERVEALRKMPAPWAHRGLSGFARTYLPPRKEELPGTLFPEEAEYLLPLALDGNSVLPSGQARRGWLLFRLPEETTVEDWRLGSLIFDELSLPVSGEIVDEPLLRFTRLEMPDDGDEAFWSRVAEKVEELSARRAAVKWEKPGRMPLRVVDPELDTEAAPELPPPGLVYAGGRVLESIAGEDALKQLSSRLRWLPGDQPPWSARYGPEAVLTQNWGTESDIALLAERVLNRSGVRTERVEVDLLEAGRKELVRRSGLAGIGLERLPAIRFRDSNGRDKVLVSPFLEGLGALEGVVSYRTRKVEEDRDLTVAISVGILVEPGSGQRGEQMQRMTDVLAGEEAEGPEEFLLLQQTAKLVDLSTGLVDVAFTRVPARGTLVYKAILDGPAGRHITPDEEAPEVTAGTVKGWFYEIETPEKTYRRQFVLPEQTEITGVFLTLAINLPDLPSASLAALDEARREMRETADVAPDTFSGLRWYTHGIAARLLGAQSAWEHDLAGRLDLTVGRSSRTRCFVITVTKDTGEGPLRAHLDLLDPNAQIHHSPNSRAERAFRILNGLAIAGFEGAALGPHGSGLWQIWQQSPPQTRLLFVADDNRDEFLELVRSRSYPPRLVEYLAETDRILLFPSSPGIIGGKVRWGWLEVDPDTYEIRAVLDDGSGGALVESLIGNLYEQASSYLVGAFVGISTSLWSVSAFSLELEDYREILKHAESFARGLAKNFSVGNDYAGLPIGGLPSASVSFDRALSFSLDPTGLSFSNNMLGFGNGYQDGITYYFQKAK